MANIITPDQVFFKGHFDVEHTRGGILLAKHRLINGVTNEGKNRILNCMFYGATQIAAASWYMGLINASGYTAIAATDTIAFAGLGWSELTSYSGSNRIAWGPVSSSSQATTNTTPVQFTMNATANVKGIFICNVQAKSTGGTPGTDCLWNTALFTADVAVENADVFKVTYTVSC